MQKPELFLTEDGSHSIRLTYMDETYHSQHGAWQESMHVFIEAGFRHFHKQKGLGSYTIFEMGFGTGLNVFQTALEAELLGVQIELTTIEKFPLDKDITDQLNFYEQASGEGAKDLLNRIHHCPWGTKNKISDFFNLHKIEGDIATVDIGLDKYQLVYFDAFAPGKQSEVWSLPILQKIFDGMTSGGMLTTYCAQGQFKRNLKTMGFEVEVLSGPPGKFEMVRAAKI